MKKVTDRLNKYLPGIIISPTFAIMIIFIYGFIIWNFILSISNSTFLPSYDIVGFKHYIALFQNDRWLVALKNLFIFSFLFIALCIIVGLGLAILLDKQIRGENILRTIYLYPMALSFIATGTVWKWILNPGLGLEKLFKEWGFENFSFDWLVNPEMSIYTIIIAAVWQSSGFVMVLLLAGLRSINDEIIKAALIDGANSITIHRKIILPQLTPFIFSSVIILTHIAVKTFDLVIAMTKGGPGYSSTLPSIFMFDFSFTRSKLAFGAASATVMLFFIMLFIIPYLYSQLRKTK